jgi:uncharacterized membrane protein
MTSEEVPMYGGMMGSSGLFMVLDTLLVLVLVLGAVALVYRIVVRSDDEPRAVPRAEQLLAERYVRGEIDRAEFEERRATLHAG